MKTRLSNNHTQILKNMSDNIKHFIEDGELGFNINDREEVDYFTQMLSNMDINFTTRLHDVDTNVVIVEYNDYR
ncbi:hypothetical protein [Bacillus sp. NPDC094106]|uniref:hypothetical protein n=1 Tax=Bacillus sp. NPDC094106 TaxID=3363949 RepID=UPI00381F411D